MPAVSAHPKQHLMNVMQIRPSGPRLKAHGAVPRWLLRQNSRQVARLKRTQSQVERLQRRIFDGSFTSDEDGPSTSYRAVSLPSVVQEKLFISAIKRRATAQAQDLTRMDIAASRLLALSAELDADVLLVARMCIAEGHLLLLEPSEVHERVQALSSVLRVPYNDALQLALREPAVLNKPAPTLRASLSRVSAVLKSRGLPPLAQLARRRPDLLRCGAASVAAKLDALPGALGGVGPRAVRSVVEAYPGLLRRSPRAVQARHQALVSLLSGLPRSYISELLVTAPGLMQLTPALLTAKFKTLMDKYGSFHDDVVDVVLVDPQALLTAKVEWKKKRSGGTVAVKRGEGVASSLETQRTSLGQGTHSSNAASGKATGSLQVKGQKRVAAAGWRSGVHQLVAEAAAAGIPLYDALVLCSGSPASAIDADTTVKADSKVPVKHSFSKVLQHSSSKRKGMFSLVGRVQALASAVGVTKDRAKHMAGRCPALLQLGSVQLRSRMEALEALLEDDSGVALNGTAGKASATSTATPATPSGPGRQISSTVATQAMASMLERQPELLLQAPGEMQTRVQVLQSQLGVAPQRAMQLLRQQPRLLLLPSDMILQQLEALSALLGGVSSSVMGELISKEPALLEAPIAAIAARFQNIAASFGSFIDDARDVVLADPRTLLQSAPRVLDKGRVRGMDGGTSGGAGKRNKGGRQAGQGSAEMVSGPQGMEAVVSGRGRTRQVLGAGAQGGQGLRGQKTEEEMAAAAAFDGMLKAESDSAKANMERRRQQREKAKAAQQQQQ